METFPNRRNFLYAGLAGGLLTLSGCRNVNLPIRGRSQSTVPRVVPLKAGAKAIQVKVPRPNIIFLVVDDLGWSDLPCYGNPFHLTPNIDKLAQRSVRFNQAYASSAVCSPTRASMQTGKHPARLKLTDWLPGRKPQADDPLKTPFPRDRMSLSERTVGEVLKRGGYQTGWVGKWHLGGDDYAPQDQGYKYNAAGSGVGSTLGPNHMFSPYNLPSLKNGKEGEYLTDRLTKEALWQVKQFRRNPDKPFFLTMSYYNVHKPLQAKPGMADKYFARKDPASPWQNSEYAAVLESVDQSVGNLLAALEKEGIANDTLVVLTSDNGGDTTVTSNEPLRGNKGSYYEGGIRVPLLMSWPRRLAAGVTEVPVSSTDFFPTLLEAARVRPEPTLHKDGRSVFPAIQGKPIHRALHWHYPHYGPHGATPTSAIRRGDLKLIRDYETGVNELYDLSNDPRESVNLAKAKPGLVAELDRELSAWLQSVDAAMPGGRKGALKPGTFSQLVNAQVEKSARGFKVSSRGNGCALQAFRAPASSFTMTCTIDILSKAPQRFENAMLVLGEGAESLFTFAFYRSKKGIAIGRFGVAKPIAESDITVVPVGPMQMTVTVTPTEVRIAAGDTELRQRLGRPLQVNTIGYAVQNAVIDVSPIKVSAGAGD